MNGGFNVLDAIALFILACFAVVLYFLPFLIASQRNLRQKETIGYLNLFLGWTSVAWVALVIFAALAEPAQPPASATQVSSIH